MNKSGLSPLSSTIILLVVSILIGLIVMTWGQSYVQQAASGSVNTVSAPQNPTVLQDLNDRLSRGEITQDQYNQIKSVLLKQNN